jgi:hypothetical protein
MSGSQDIREWAASNGIDVAGKGPIKGEIKDKYYESHPDEFAGLPSDTSEVTDTGERMPDEAPPEKGGVSFWNKRKKAKTPSSRGGARRTSIEGIVSAGWGFGAMLVASKQNLLPVARVLEMQSPVAGVIVNDLAKGTIVDKILQPFARAGDKGEQMMGLIGPPLITTAILTKPELYPVLRPVLKMSMMSWLELAEPAMKKVQAKQEKFAERFGEIDLDGMIDAIFAPPPGYTPEGADEDASRN